MTCALKERIRAPETAYAGLHVVLASAMKHVMQADTLDKRSLAPVNAYNPGLSGAWMLQRAMSVRPGEEPNPDFINQVTLMPCHG